MQGSLNLKHLRYFHEVARYGSITEASRRLGTSPSTISEQVRLLEGRLSQPLFRRTRKGLQPTEAGEVVWRQSQVIFEAVDRMLEHFQQSQERVSTLRVGNAASLGRAQTAADLLPLLEMEGVRLRLETASASQLMRSLAGGELDLVLSDREPPPSLDEALAAEPLVGSPLVVVVGARHAHLSKHGVDGLKQLPMLQYLVSSRYRWDVEQWLRAQDMRPEVLGEVDDVSLLLAAARASLCFAVVPQAALLDAGIGLHVVARLGDHVQTQRFAIHRSEDGIALVERALDTLRKASGGQFRETEK